VWQFLGRIEFLGGVLGADVGKGVTICNVKIHCNVSERVWEQEWVVVSVGCDVLAVYLYTWRHRGMTGCPAHAYERTGV
jgi:hypothetical protein